jgi:hypothetical protein
MLNTSNWLIKITLVLFNHYLFDPFLMLFLQLLYFHVLVFEALLTDNYDNSDVANSKGERAFEDMDNDMEKALSYIDFNNKEDIDIFCHYLRHS